MVVFFKQDVGVCKFVSYSTNLVDYVQTRALMFDFQNNGVPLEIFFLGAPFQKNVAFF